MAGGETFGTRLRWLRERRGETQATVARRCGLTASRIAQLEGGSDPNPRLSTIVALSRALDCDAAGLFLAATNDGLPFFHSVESRTRQRAASTTTHPPSLMQAALGGQQQLNCTEPHHVVRPSYEVGQ